MHPMMISETKLEMINQLTGKQATSNNIKVFARFRPLNEFEQDLLEKDIGSKCVEYLYPGKVDELEEDKKKFEQLQDKFEFHDHLISNI